MVSRFVVVIMKLKWILIVIASEIFALIYVVYKLDLIELKLLVTLGLVELVAVVFGYLFNWWGKSKEKEVRTEDERRKELNSYIHKHSKDLANEVLKKWFSPSPNIHIALPDSYITAQTPIYVAIYSPHSKSRLEDYITLCIEHSLLKYSDEAKEHLKEYSKSKEWLECEQASKEYSKDVMQICESIEEKILAGIPEGFTEYTVGTTEADYYILDKTVDAVYRDAKRFTEKGGFYNLFKKVSGDGCFKVVDSDSIPYVKSFDERSVDEFIEFVHMVAKDPVIVERIRTIKDKNKHTVKRFKDLLTKIRDDVERNHENLKGTCRCCEVWYDELKSLN